MGLSFFLWGEQNGATRPKPSGIPFPSRAASSPSSLPAALECKVKHFVCLRQPCIRLPCGFLGLRRLAPEGIPSTPESGIPQKKCLILFFSCFYVSLVPSTVVMCFGYYTSCPHSVSQESRLG